MESLVPSAKSSLDLLSSPTPLDLWQIDRKGNPPVELSFGAGCVDARGWGPCRGSRGAPSPLGHAAALGRAAPPCPLVGDVRGAAPAARLVASPLPVIFLGGDRISPFGGGRLRSCSPSPFPLLRPFFCSDGVLVQPSIVQDLFRYFFTDVWIVGLICIANGRIIYA